jgi:ribose transport system ATP-binding protein
VAEEDRRSGGFTRAEVRPLDEAAAISVRGVGKSFAGVKVLDAVDLEVAPGEVHALLGQNGAGKSTLVKILAGTYVRDSGEVEMHGEPLPRRFDQGEPARRGVAFVHQDRGLIDNLSVAENVAFVVDFARRRGGLIDWRRSRSRARDLLAGLATEIDVEETCERLSPAERAIVAIARAIALDARTLVLDEPTASLARSEADLLFDFVGRARAEGKSFIYISHHLEEVFELADRVTVLRDGRVVIGAEPVAELDRARIVEALTGGKAKAAAAAPARDLAAAPVRLKVGGLAAPGLAPLDFELRAGEIVGMTGVVGSGPALVPRLLFGVAAPTAGRLEIGGRRTPIPRSPLEAIRAGLEFVPGDRGREGLIAPMSISDNVHFNAHVRGRRSGPLDRRRERRSTLALDARLSIRPNDPERSVNVLSGGNQQKVLLARFLRDPGPVIFVEDPTTGVDVGAKADIHRALRENAETGQAVVVISSDEEEVVELCDRALVFASGRVVASFERAQLNERDLVMAATGSGAEFERRGPDDD